MTHYSFLLEGKHLEKSINAINRMTPDKLQKVLVKGKGIRERGTPLRKALAKELKKVRRSDKSDAGRMRAMMANMSRMGLKPTRDDMLNMKVAAANNNTKDMLQGWAGINKDFRPAAFHYMQQN